MIKRLISSLGLLLCLCFTTLAINKELTVKLNSRDRVVNEKLGFANITFEYLYSVGNNAVVKVSVENMTGNPPHALIFFKRPANEQNLKKGKPKIEFDKTYGGDKGERPVSGNKDYNKDYIIIPAGETDSIFTIEVPFTSPKDLIIPFYEAKYKAKDLYKKREKGLAGEYNISYKLLEFHECFIHIEVIGWSEDDPTYVKTKNAVDNFISSLDGVKFCYNKKHSPSLKEQQRQYQEEKDSLIKVISDINQQSDWLSTDAPHIAYTKLIKKLNDVNLNNMTHDCGEHKPKPKVHSCSFCSLSAQEIYQRLDDLYQQLYAGKLNKDQALKTAKSLYNCYQQNKKRKKDSSYGTKISRFYNSITNY